MQDAIAFIISMGTVKSAYLDELDAGDARVDLTARTIDRGGDVERDGDGWRRGIA